MLAKAESVVCCRWLQLIRQLKQADYVCILVQFLG